VSQPAVRRTKYLVVPRERAISADALTRIDEELAEVIIGLDMLIDSVKKLSDILLERVSPVTTQVPPAGQAPEIYVKTVYEIDLHRYNEVFLPNGGEVSEFVQFRNDRNVALVTARVRYLGSASTGLKIYWMYGVDPQYIDTLSESVAEHRYVELGVDTVVQRTVVVPLIMPATMILFRNDTGSDVELKYWIHVARVG